MEESGNSEILPSSPRTDGDTTSRLNPNGANYSDKESTALLPGDWDRIFRPKVDDASVSMLLASVPVGGKRVSKEICLSSLRAALILGIRNSEGI